MPKKGDIGTLEVCLKKAHGDGNLIADCEAKFVSGGGEPSEGGKVFSDGESPTLVVTKGGKVFHIKE